MSERRVRVHLNKQENLLNVPSSIQEKSLDSTFIEVKEVSRDLKLRHIFDCRPETPTKKDWIFLDSSSEESEEIKGKPAKRYLSDYSSENVHRMKRLHRDLEEKIEEYPDDSSSNNSLYFPGEYDRYLKEMAKNNPLLAQNFKETVDYIKKNDPDPVYILTAPLLLEDRANLLQIYDILSETLKPSQEYFDCRKYLNKEIEIAKRKYRDYNNLSETFQQSYQQEKDILINSNTSLSLDYQIIALDAPIQTKSIIYKEYLRMQNLGAGDDEKCKLERWIETCLNLPFRRFKQLPDDRTLFLQRMRNTLDKEIYGMDKVKEQILIFTNARLSNPQMKECTLGLIGPPGIGKTMIAKLLSTCLTLPFSQISCGGISEGEIIKGYAYTYIGSRPGEIVNSLIEMKYNNGVIFFDEFEKISRISSITSMLLHVLDPVQNAQYQDNYLGKDIKVDLSGIWFVLSMNDPPTDNALRDRIYPIYMSGYNSQEKKEIAKRHLIPKICANLKIESSVIQFPDTTLDMIITRVCPNTGGVRSLQHALKEIITKVHFLQQSNLNVSFTLKNITIPYVVTQTSLDKLLTQSPDSTYLTMYM